jgi:hypothetical protein
MTNCNHYVRYVSYIRSKILWGKKKNMDRLFHLITMNYYKTKHSPVKPVSVTSQFFPAKETNIESSKL